MDDFIEFFDPVQKIKKMGRISLLTGVDCDEENFYVQWESQGGIIDLDNFGLIWFERIEILSDKCRELYERKDDEARQAVKKRFVDICRNL